MSHYDMRGKIYTLKQDAMGQDWHGYDVPEDKEFTDHPLPKGTKVKVVMASRFGDVGITDDLKRTHGYIARVDPDILEEIK